jgi:hypothetical protein
MYCLGDEMKHNHNTVRLGFTSLLLAMSIHAHAQSLATATQRISLSVFAAGTEAATGIQGGNDHGVTAGGDISFLPVRRYTPSVELRGTNPVGAGSVDNQKLYLVGPKIERRLGVLHPYLDVLVGRGKVHYSNGVVVGQLAYLSSTSFVVSPGVGVDVDLARRIGLKADLQLQHWSTPVITSGDAYPKSFSLGALYRFDFNRR